MYAHALRVTSAFMARGSPEPFGEGLASVRGLGLAFKLPELVLLPPKLLPITPEGIEFLPCRHPNHKSCLPLADWASYRATAAGLVCRINLTNFSQSQLLQQTEPPFVERHLEAIYQCLTAALCFGSPAHLPSLTPCLPESCPAPLPKLRP